MKNETARREIESLDYYLQNHTNDYSEESHMAMMMAIDALSSSEKPNKWIPVSKKLPKPYDEEVMVTTRCGEISKATLIYMPYRTDAEEKGLYNWRFRNSDTSFDYVTAWMPLPPSYQGE